MNFIKFVGFIVIYATFSICATAGILKLETTEVSQAIYLVDVDHVDFEAILTTYNTYMKDDSSAMVDINFSRYNSSDQPLSKTDVTYMLVFKDNMWKLKGDFVHGNLSLGKQ